MNPYSTQVPESVNTQVTPTSVQLPQSTQTDPHQPNISVTSYVKPISTTQQTSIPMHLHQHQALSEQQWRYQSQHLTHTTQSLPTSIPSQSIQNPPLLPPPPPPPPPPSIPSSTTNIIPPIPEQPSQEVGLHQPHRYHPHHIADGHVDKVHSYAPTINMVTGPPPPHTQYLYPVHHQLIAPIAHVPIGAAHYAHLPPSIWNPPRPAYPQSIPSHPSAHHLATAHHPSHIHTHPPPASVHHLTPSHHPHPSAYSVSQPQPIGPQEIHSHHPHVAYGIAQIHAPQPSAVQTHSTTIHPEIRTVSGHVPYATVPTAIISTSQEGSKLPNFNDGKIDNRVNGSTINNAAKLAVSIPPSTMPYNSAANKNIMSSPGVRMDSIATSQSQPIHIQSDNHFLSGLSQSDRQNNHNNGNISSEKPKSNSENEKSSDTKQNSQTPPRQPMRKPRKPYTSTKAREVWTAEEHARFVAALGLYKRDWKRIETYIGTKTVLQIRSHAQKYFGKVAKNGSGAYIPPPRPKKRAQLPYPRSRNMGTGKLSTSVSGTGSDNGSGNDITSRAGTSYRNINVSNAQSNGTSITNPSRSDTAIPTSTAPIRDSRLAVNSIVTNDQYENQSNRPSWNEGDNHNQTTDQRPIFYQNTHSQPNSLNHSRQIDQTNQYQAIASRPIPLNHRPIGYSQQEPRIQNNWNEPVAAPNHTSREKRRKSFETDLQQQRRSNSTNVPVDIGQNTDLPVLKPLSELQKNQQREKGRRIMSHQQLSSPPKVSGNVINEECHPSREGNTTMNSSDSPPTGNDPLVVLSNCVDMVSRDNASQQRRDSDWNTAGSSRQDIITRVTPETEPPSSDGRESGNDANRAQRRISNNITNNQNNENLNQSNTEKRHREGDQNKEPHPISRATSNAGSGGDSQGRRSISPDAGPSDSNETTPPDPQRSSAGSGNGSDDAIAGFSSSDRPSVSDMGASNGSGSSPNSSDLGDPEVEPKSSNDGSGDDGNRQSPSIRGSSPADPNSSPADPNSSVSRENTPNSNPDCDNNVPAQPRQSAPTNNQQSGNGQSDEKKNNERTANNSSQQPKSRSSPSLIIEPDQRDQATVVPRRFIPVVNQEKGGNYQQTKRVLDDSVKNSNSTYNKANYNGNDGIKLNEHSFGRKRPRSPESGDDNNDVESHQVIRRRESEPG